MKEIIVKIKEEDSGLVTQLLEKLGAEVIESKPVKKKSISTTKKKEEEISPTYLFGKWKDLDIDPKKLREESWGRHHKSL